MARIKRNLHQVKQWAYEQALALAQELGARAAAAAAAGDPELATALNELSDSANKLASKILEEIIRQNNAKSDRDRQTPPESGQGF